MAQETAKPSKTATVSIDALDAKILSEQAVNPRISNQKLADKLGANRETIRYRRKRLEESDLVQQARQGLIDLLPAAVGIYRDVVRPSLDSDVDTRLRVDVAGNILRGTGAHVERNRTETSTIPATAEAVHDALQSLSTYELNRFFAICEGRDPESANTPDVVDGTDSPPDASGSGVELQAQPVPEGDLPRPVA